MHVLVVNFNLKGIKKEDYLGLIEPMAPVFAGLVSKTWLANERTNTYGGVYIWSDRESMEAYTTGGGVIPPHARYESGDAMNHTHSTRQAVRPGAERRHVNRREEESGPRPTQRNHAKIPNPRLRAVAAPGGVAFVEESPVGRSGAGRVRYRDAVNLKQGGRR